VLLTTAFEEALLAASTSAGCPLRSMTISGPDGYFDAMSFYWSFRLSSKGDDRSACICLASFDSLSPEVFLDLIAEPDLAPEVTFLA